jgi:hypothetical protein
MRDVGCDGALVASALHTGRVSASDLSELAVPAPWNDQSETSASR